jgi:exosortase/archaeosortase family protein
LRRFLLLFTAAYAALYGASEAARAVGLTVAVVHWGVLQPAAMWLAAVAGFDHVEAVENRLLADGVRLNVLPGCEGTEAWTLLLAATLAAPLTWPAKLAGALFSTLLVLLLSQWRIVALMLTLRHDRGLFAALHGYVAPTLLVVVLALYFLAFLRVADRGV